MRSWLVALYGTIEMVTRKVAQMGHVLPRRSPTGEVLSVASSDSDEFGALSEILARALAQLASYLTVASIVLTMSWQLGAARPWWPHRSSSARRCRCCGRCTAASRSSAAAPPT